MLGANLDFLGANRVFAQCVATCAGHGARRGAGWGAGMPSPVGGRGGLWGPSQEILKFKP